MDELRSKENQSEQRYKRMFETARDGILILDESTTTVLDANPHIKRLFGTAPEQLRGRALLQIFPFAGNSVVLELLEKARREGVALIDAQFPTARGEMIDAEILCNTYTEGGQKVIQCNIRETTARKRAERALQESEERLRLLVEGVHDYGMFLMDTNNRIVSWNRGAEAIFGYPEKEILGQSGVIIFTPEDRERGEAEREIGTAIREGRAEDERWHLRKDGRRIFCSGVLTALRDANGALRGFAKVFRDVTERRETEEALRETQHMESIAVLAGGVAHDFNNLLTTILGNAALAIEDIPRFSPAHRPIENVIQASRRAADLTRQLLAYSGHGRFVVEHLQISELVDDILPLVESSLPKTVHLRLRLAGHLPTLEADASQIQQILMNLVINAGEAIGDAEGVVTIATGAEVVSENQSRLQPGTYVWLEVSDTGAGMDEAAKARIFEPFFTTKFTGRGLGLAAVAGIIRQHGGTIQVESKPGEGSRFRVFLRAVDEGEPADRAPAAAARAPFQVKGGGTVLVVDDEEYVREIAQAALERRGYGVLLAEDGRQAIEIFRQHAGEVAAVLLDMAMPVMSGRAAFPELKEIRPEIPIVVTSGYGETDAAKQFGEQGPVVFLQKPFTPDELVEKVYRTIEAASMSSESVA
ncbi:MAG TPA: PAS domain S-box protein [Bryobacteraceae bacterium]|nr:PAS domain S-box protein [Bryobacteraceae bacterium]